MSDTFAAIARPSLFQYPALPTMHMTWFGQRVEIYQGKITELAEKIPTFDRIPFDLNGLCNPKADIIVREPIESDDRRVPVAMVSKYYELISHHEILGWLESALRPFNIQWSQIPAILMLSEFGEKMYLRFIVPGYHFQPGDGHWIYLQAHILNSLDKSVALQLRLGWYRAICANGLFWGKEVGNIRRIHTTIQSPMDLPMAFASEINKIEEEKKRIIEWFEEPITLAEIEDWADAILTEKLGLQLAARICHIGRTGHDALVEQINKKTQAHACACRTLLPISGMSGPARNVFDALQILSYVSRDRGNIQDQIEMMNKIPELMKPLLKSTR